MREPTRRLEVPPAQETACPVCSTQGTTTSFADLYLCMTDGCRVWSYEARLAPDERPKRTRGILDR